METLGLFILIMAATIYTIIPSIAIKLIAVPFIIIGYFVIKHSKPRKKVHHG